MTIARTLGFALLFALAAAAPSLAISAFGAPVVVVYPLTLTSAVRDSEVGSDVAILISTKISEGGEITVRPYTPGTTRAQYLDAAVKLKADYYVTGYLQQIGSDVSMILQVVSTHSGSVVYSSTTTIKTFGDATAQAEPLRAAVLRHAGRGLAALDAPPPAPEPSAEPTTNQGVNLTRALRRRVKSSPTPSPAPSSDAGLVSVAEIQASVASASPRAVAITTSPLLSATTIPTSTTTSAPTPPATSAPTPLATPSPSAARPVASSSAPMQNLVRKGANVSDVLVLDTESTEAEPVRTRTSASLVGALRRAGIPAARLAISASAATANAANICRANAGALRFFAPVLVLSHDPKGAGVAKLSVTAIDCTGVPTARHDATGIGTPTGGDASAIDRAATALVPFLTNV